MPMLEVTEVAWMSPSPGLVAPTTTILPVISAGDTRPSTRSTKDTLGTVPTGPGKSIQAEPSAKEELGTDLPFAVSTVATPTECRPSTKSGYCWITPLELVGKLAAATLAWALAGLPAPPSSAVKPGPPTSFVARTTLRARATASKKAFWCASALGLVDGRS